MSGGNISINGADFITRGKEAGLGNKEIKLLKKTADILKMDKPLTLMGSVTNIDNAISQIDKLLKSNNYSDLDLIDHLEELYDYRKKIELERLEKKSIIQSTKELGLNQQVKIMVGNIETPIIGHVTENNPNYLAIDLIKTTSIKPGINWDGPINVYFWKKDDAGYYFESLVGETPTPQQWKIAHSSSLIRSQKREDIRVDVEINAYVYKLDDISKKNSKHEGFVGTFAQLKNISEGGAAFLINGIINKTTPLKIEFILNENTVVVCGVVKDSSYNKINNISYVRMKIVEPDFIMLSYIRSFLYTSSRELFESDSNKNEKPVENKAEIHNNEDINDAIIEEDIVDVEYLND